MEAQGINLIGVLIYGGMCALVLGSVGVVIMLLLRRNR
jgi:hypothetical protein